MTAAEILAAVCGIYGLLFIGYCAGWADCERKHMENER